MSNKQSGNLENTSMCSLHAWSNKNVDSLIEVGVGVGWGWEWELITML